MPAQSVSLTVDTAPIERAFERGPQTAYFWLRSWLFRALLNHRTTWLRSKSTRFGRGRDAIKVWRINAAPKGPPDPKWVVYRVTPDARRQPSRAAASRALPKLLAEAHAGSVALEVHQFGTDIDVGNRWLAIPVRRGPRSPKAWRARNPTKQLVTIPDPRRSDVLYLAEPKRYRGRRQRGRKPRNRRKKVVRTKLIWRFVLVHRVEMEPTLDFYESWDSLESARQTDFESVADRIVQDIARGKLA